MKRASEKAAEPWGRAPIVFFYRRVYSGGQLEFLAEVTADLL